MTPGVKVEVALDYTTARAVLDRLAGLDGDQTALMRKIGDQVKQRVDERFEGGFGPGGVPWKRSRRAAEQGGKTLVDSARLAQSITREPGPRSVVVGTNVAYAAIHQFGGTIRAKTPKGLVFRVGGQAGRSKGSWRRMMQVVIPARPFLGIDREDIADIDAVVTGHLARLARAGGAA
jgi:phage virion morphogenesis protein